MRIDGTYGLGPRKATDEKEAKASGIKSELAGSPSAAGGAEMVSSQERLIAAAFAVPEVNAQAVQEARALLESGQLDSPESVRRAAERMIDLGL